jgi:predicted nucleic acid-binding protein
VSFLLDTNVLSELRKGARADAGVVRWFDATDESALFISVLVLGELTQGIESVRRRDKRSARALEQWLRGLFASYGDRVLPIDAAVAQRWGELNVPDRLPAVDGLMAATAIVHGLTVVTRNTDDFERTGVAMLNPFDH